MRIDEVRRLIRLVEESEIGELEVWKWWGRIRIRKSHAQNGGAVQVTTAGTVPGVVNTAHPPSQMPPAPATPEPAPAVEEEFRAARARGNEGLVGKDPGSAYTPGRRGLAWIKLKKEFATLDVVVTGVEYGHGRRREHGRRRVGR